MAEGIQCNRCKAAEFDKEKLKDWETLDYWSKGIGHYWRIHLCPSCKRDHDKWLKGKQ